MVPLRIRHQSKPDGAKHAKIMTVSIYLQISRR